MAAGSMSMVPVALALGDARDASGVDLACVLHPLPEGSAYAGITEDGDAGMQRGDVVRVDLRVTRFVGDSTYAVEIDGRQAIRRVQARSDGLFVYWGEAGETVDPGRLRILGMVKSRQGLRSLSVR